MSSLTRSVKAKIAGFLQDLLRKLVTSPDERPGPAGSATASLTLPARATAPPPNGIPHPSGAHHNGAGIELPLQPILDGLPLELQPCLIHPSAGAQAVSVPLERILAQLSSGAVKISFGDLRLSAPGLFTTESDRDHVLVSIPLAEVITRLDPAFIMRRREQKQVEVSDDIRGPFDRPARGLVPSGGPTQPEIAPPPQVAPPARDRITFTPPPAPPTAPPLEAPARSAAPRPQRDLGGSPSLPVSAPPSPASQLAISADSLVMSLKSLAEGWPEAVRKEIVQFNLIYAKVALPLDVVELALKQGRVAFTWKTLRSWIRPNPLAATSAHDSAVLELPLKIVAPLFLARQQELNKGQKKFAIDEEIPDLFFSSPGTESGVPRAAPAAKPVTSKPADANHPARDDASDRIPLQGTGDKARSKIETDFIARHSSPNEVVTRAAALDGVAGALIALSDGLLVANRLSSDLNGETLAAFLPQIFAKVNQCAKELRMGELNTLDFTVGDVPWKIFRVHAIFFAVFGGAGKSLPAAQLAALAAELDHKPK